MELTRMQTKSNELMRKLPIGIQGFEGLREDGYLYVDKTEYIYRLIQTGKYYFLSRPRRFGKSLLLSTMKAYWEGKRELFAGLKIEELEKDNPDAWKVYPVFVFDFNGQNYRADSGLEDMLDIHLKRWEEQYGLPFGQESLEIRFQNLMIAAKERTGLRCVVLIDEYDKSLLEAMEKPELEEHNKAVFKSFFSNLKSYDEFLQFVFITGVTKFEKISIFSDLNQMNDISLMEEYSGICGITERELTDTFQAEIAATAVKQQMSTAECLRKLKKRYDGYHFHPSGAGVYNPFSLLKCFYEKDFGSYWFSTGTPTFLVKKLKTSGFDVRKLTDKTLYASESMLTDYRADNPDPIPLLYQTGYLTIAAYDRELREYTLTFPNEEVEYGFLESLTVEYLPGSNAGSGTDIFTLRRCAVHGDLDGMQEILTALFADIPYTEGRNPFEHYFQTVIYLVFKMLGQFTRCEVHSSNGRADCIVETDKYVYLFEFKRDDTAEAALRQIEEKGYTLSYAADPRTLYEIGVAFDSQKRTLSDWKVKEH